MQQAIPHAVYAAQRQIVGRIYQQSLLAMIEDLEKQRPEAIDWFKNELEDVAQVAGLAGFSANAVLRTISYPLRRGELKQVLARIKEVRELLASE